VRPGKLLPANYRRDAAVVSGLRSSCSTRDKRHTADEPAFLEATIAGTGEGNSAHRQSVSLRSLVMVPGSGSSTGKLISDSELMQIRYNGAQQKSGTTMKAMQIHVLITGLPPESIRVTTILLLLIIIIQ